MGGQSELYGKCLARDHHNFINLGNCEDQDDPRGFSSSIKKVNSDDDHEYSILKIPNQSFVCIPAPPMLGYL